jgi:hypothetical protein
MFSLSPQVRDDVSLSPQERGDVFSLSLWERAGVRASDSTLLKRIHP